MWRLLALALVATFVTGCGSFEPAAFPWVDWIAGIANLAIFMFIIIKFGGHHIQEYFRNRRETFIEQMEAATAAREEAEAKLEEYNAKLDALEQERQALLDEYHARGEREKQRIVESAKKQVEKMRRDASATIEQEVKKAKAALESQAVELAVDMAREQAKKELDDAKQKQLVDRYVDELDGAESRVN